MGDFTIRGNVKAQRVTIGTSATAIPTSALGSRKGMILKPITNRIYVGDANVTVAAGYPLDPDEAMPLVVDGNAVIYGISEGGSEIAILEGQ